MHYDFFCVPVDSPEEDSIKLNAFLSSHCIVHVDRQFYQREGAAFWSFCVHWRALTSQHFANYYLNVLDRMVIALDETLGYVRYMDDFLCWAENSEACKRIHRRVRDFLGDHLKLEVHSRRQIQRSYRGVTFGGYRVLPDRLLLSHRRKVRYMAHYRKYEAAYASGRIGVDTLQRLYQSAYALTVHSDSLSWRKSVHRGNSDWMQ